MNAPKPLTTIEMLVPADARRLEVALGKGEPKPWPSSHVDDLLDLERQLAEDLPPTARRGAKEISRVLELLDSLQQKGHGNV